MSAVKITDRLTVASQPEIGEISDLAKDYAALINLRPDGEEPHQPGNDAEHDAAANANLGYAFVPVTGSTITEADIRAFQQAMHAADGPGYAHCQGGTMFSARVSTGECGARTSRLSEKRAASISPARSAGLHATLPTNQR